MSAPRESGEPPLQAAPSGTADAEMGRRAPLRGILEQLQTLGIALVLALAIRAFVIEPYRIPSGSMFPTLLVGDHLFVNKFIYGIRLPLLDRRLPAVRQPQRGDVVVFTVARDGRDIYPADRRSDLPRDRFVKRIIGLPGDRIEMRDEALYINGGRVEQLATEEVFTDGLGRDLQVVREALDGRPHLILDDPDRSGDSLSFTVEPGRYFVMGDNRDDSNDSRIWGTVRFEEFKGPAFVLYWSWDWNGSWGALANPVTWWELLSERMRWSRIGDSIE